jgi:hypothetical protein
MHLAIKQAKLTAEKQVNAFKMNVPLTRGGAVVIATKGAN